MAGAEYEEKRGPNLGTRSTVRHGAQAGASAGGLALLLQALVDAGKIDIHGAFLALAILTPVLTTVWKLWDGLEGMARLKALLNRVAPLAVALGLLSGCAMHIGTADPEQFSTLGGGTMIACETRGITIAFGDADVCSNSMRGGRVSQTFSDMTLGTMRVVGSAIAGFFGGAGAGMYQAMAATPAPAAVEAPAVPTVSEPIEPDSTGELETFGNPFVAPDPD